MSIEEIQQYTQKISVIILCYNNLEYTKMCIDSVLEHTQYPNYEVIVVDNASTDGTAGYLEQLCKEHNHIQQVCLATNTGFSKGNNHGVVRSTGEILVILNNDTIVTDNWLVKFSKCLQDSTIGMIGPAVNFSGNETQVPIGYQQVDEINDFAKFFASQYAMPAFEINVLPFHCVAMRKSVWDQVGELDSRFGIGMFEDDDYSMRVKNAGYRLICADDIYIHHWGRKSFSKMDNTAHDRLFAENKAKFEAKWDIRWKPHQHRSLLRYLR